jgi:hypothetical protein
MKKLNAILFHFLPNAAHYNFTAIVRTALENASANVKEALGDLLTQFILWNNKEFAALEWLRKSVLTEKIAEADHRLDRAIVALNAQVHALEYSLTTDIAEAAHRMSLMLNSYGKVYNKPYDEEIGDVRLILGQFNGPFADEVASLGVAALCSEIDAAFTEFNNLFEERGAETLNKPDISLRQVRREEDRVYHQITVLLNAGAAMGTPGFAEVIDRLNPDIEHMNEQFHRAKKDLGTGNHTVVEPIETQPYTEKPVTVIPKVYYREEGKPTVQLSLGSDFSVTYKNNINVGTAELIIHGKGAYKGQFTVKFNIAR